MMSCFPATLFKCLMNDRVMVSLVPVISGSTFVFTFQIHCFYVVRSLYFKILSSFLIMIILPEISAFTKRYHVCSFLIATDNGDWFIVRNGSVSLYFFISQYGFLACNNRFYWSSWCPYNVPCVILPLMLACGKMKLRKLSILSLYEFSFCKYLAQC